MVVSRRRGAEVWCAGLLMLAAVISGGCGGRAGEHEDAHAVPEHHPRTFRQAVIDMAHRGTVLTSGMLDGGSREIQRSHLLDIVRWLPELAADTEMGRRDWERVRDVARQLAGELEGFAGGSPEDASRLAGLTAMLESATKMLSAMESSLPVDLTREEKP